LELRKGNKGKKGAESKKLSPSVEVYTSVQPLRDHLTMPEIKKMLSTLKFSRKIQGLTN
jgi:hypothetical protein